MTAAGHMSRTIRDDLHGVSAPILLAKYLQLAYTSRLSLSPDNTHAEKWDWVTPSKAGTHVGKWIPAFAGMTG